MLLVLEQGHLLGVVSRRDALDVALGIKSQLVNAYLPVEAMHGLGVVVAVIDNIIAPIQLNHRMMAGAMNGLVLIGGQQFTLVLERSHRAGL